MNYINFAARVCPIELLEAADEVGMVMQCGDHMTVLKEHGKHYKDVWTPIVRWTRKHPSMCFYGFGGERNYYEGIIEQYQKQYDLIKSRHPECMVMPQQAIRGIDYAFDAKGKTELTSEPFGHHAERLARYTKACDLFGHYSGGAFGYNYFSTTWRQMEKRFFIYTKPLSMHELFMGASYLNPDNATRYTGRVPPYLYTTLRDDLTEAGLIDRWRTYHTNSSKLHGICKKYCVEKTRKCNELAGYEFLGMTDMHFTPHYTTGILDEFGQLKPGDSVEGILRYNNESVLLLDLAGGRSRRREHQSVVLDGRRIRGRRHGLAVWRSANSTGSIDLGTDRAQQGNPSRRIGGCERGQRSGQRASKTQDRLAGGREDHAIQPVRHARGGRVRSGQRLGFLGVPEAHGTGRGRRGR